MKMRTIAARTGPLQGQDVFASMRDGFNITDSNKKNTAIDTSDDELTSRVSSAARPVTAPGF